MLSQIAQPYFGDRFIDEYLCPSICQPVQPSLKYILSVTCQVGFDFLGLFDAATRTSSRFIAVLALLYADHQNERYSQAAWLLPPCGGAGAWRKQPPTLSITSSLRSRGEV